MKFTRVTMSSDISYGTLDVHSKGDIVESIPKQFTLEFWMKSKFHPDSTDEKEIFGLYVYEDENVSTSFGKYKNATNIDGSEQELIDTAGISSVIRIYVDADTHNYVFLINNRKVFVLKHKMDNKWNHIALVYDDLNETSCVWYLNGRPILGANMSSNTMKAFKDKKFCRFLWTCYKDDDYVYLYNVNITQNTNNSGNYGIRYNNSFNPLSLSSDYYGLGDVEEDTDPIIIPKMSHATCSFANKYLMYLPCQNYKDEDLGSWQIPISFLNNTVIDQIRRRNFVPQNHQSLGYANNTIDASGSKNWFYIDYDNYYDIGKMLISTNNLSVTSINYSVSNEDHYPWLFGFRLTKNIDFSIYNDGLTIDWFGFYSFGYNNNFLNYTESDLFSSSPFGVFNSVLNKVKPSLGDTIQYSFINNKNTNSTTNNSTFSKSFPSATSVKNIAYSNFARISYPQIQNGNGHHQICHCAIVLPPTKSTEANLNRNIYFYLNGQLLDFNMHSFEWGESRNYMLFMGFQSAFSHLRFTKTCLWGKEYFDPTTDSRLFIQIPDSNRNHENQKRKTDEDNIALLYPVKSPSTIYDRMYSATAYVNLTTDKQKSNFQVENSSTHPSKLMYDGDEKIVATGSQKPTYYQGYPAICSNTYKDYQNIIKFRNHRIEDDDWTVSLWVYPKIQVENEEFFDIFYVSGFGSCGDINNTAYTGKMNGFIGMQVCGNGASVVVTTALANKQAGLYYPYSTNKTTNSYRGGFSYNTIGKYPFVMNDWNNIVVTSQMQKDLTATTHINELHLYLNGAEIYRESNRRFSLLHRLFFYVGAKDAPVKLYFTGIRVNVGEAEHVSNKITDWQSRK